MFYNCKSLTTLDVNSFDLRKVTVALAMFGNCENLVAIYCDNDWSEMFQEEQYIFRGCYKLKGSSHEPRSARVDCKTRVEQSSACAAVGIATLPNIVTEGYHW